MLNSVSVYNTTQNLLLTMLNSVSMYNTTPRPIQYTCSIYTHITQNLLLTMLNSVRVYNTTPRPIQYTCNIYTHYTKPPTNHVEQCESVQYYTKAYTIYM